MKPLKSLYLLAISTCISVCLYGESSSGDFSSSGEPVDPRSALSTLQTTSPQCKPICSKCIYPCGRTIFAPRSQGANTARELVGWQTELYRPFLCDNYATFAIVPEYTTSYQSSRIAQSLFCRDCITFAGSQAPRNNGSDIVADNFGLPTNFTGTLSIKPSIENFIFDIELFFGLSNWCPGVYLRIHAPLVHTLWSLNLDTCSPCTGKFVGDDQFPEAYMFSKTAVTPFNPLTPTCFIHNAVNPEVVIDPTAVTNNCTTHSLRQALSGTFTFGDMTEEWNAGRFSFCRRTKTGMADIDVICGWNFIENDYAHLGFFGQVVIPTGTRPKSKYIFEPLLGTPHWQLGGGLTGHISLNPVNTDQPFNIALYVEGNATHLFKTHERRSFDFTENGLLSRYLLLKEYDINNNYIGRMINAINFCTRNAEIHVKYQVDASAKLLFAFHGWMIDLGYNFYMRDKEKVCIQTHCPCAIDERRFAIKGTEGVQSLSYPIMADMVFPETSPTLALLNSDQPQATIFVATPSINGGPVAADATSVALTWDSAQLNSSSSLPIPVSEVDAPPYIITSSAAPTIISCANLDPNSAAQQKFLSNKLFTHLGYVWYNHTYHPHFGVGAEAEFAACKRNNTLNQFGVWIKGGITF